MRQTPGGLLIFDQGEDYYTAMLQNFNMVCTCGRCDPQRLAAMVAEVLENLDEEKRRERD